MKTKIINGSILGTLIFLMGMVSPLKSQDFMGFANSNYSGLTGLTLQPAAMVDGRLKFDINIVALNIGFDNNFISYKNDGVFGINSIKRLLDTSISFREWNLSDLTDKFETFKGNDVRLNFEHSVMGPSIGMTLSPDDAVALTTRYRSILNIDGFTPELAKQGLEEILYTPLYNQVLQADGFSIDVLGWVEYGLNYGRILPLMPDRKDHFFKGGITLKLLQGLHSAYMAGSKADYIFHHDDTLSLVEVDIDYGHTTNFEINPTKDLFAFKFNGTGLGFDLGFVYEYRPDWKLYTDEREDDIRLTPTGFNKYKLKAGISFLDIGGIKFDKDPDSYDRIAMVDHWDLTNLTIESIQDFDDTINARWPLASADNKTTYRMGLPTAIILQFDVNAFGSIYVAANGFIAPRALKNVNKVSTVTNISVIPRFEGPWLGAGIPFSLTGMGHFDMGIYARLGPLFFGSQDLLSNMFGKTISHARVYAGLKITLPYKQEKIVLGDRDKDGILDIADDCIDVPGPKENNGCPYQDLDGDGVLDNADNCVDVPGPKENNGCPYGDRDQDGVLDNADECIDVPGPIANNGCPFGDKDNDGILDNVDQCIDVPGPKENNGCPYGDRDQDGVLDKDDHCIDAAGPAENNGCPYLDTDGDGVLDKDDDCIRTPGPVENKGCPIIEKEDEEILKRAFDNLEFDTGKDIIRAVSFQSLNELADLLIRKESWGLKLAGHTDNVGNDEANMILSRDRSTSVKNYLVNKGVDASRIVVEYYGETRPIATNDTPAGRQLNRRVEMNIVFD